MTQVSDPTTAATSGQSDPLADASTAWQKFVAAFAANNQGAGAIERAQQEVIQAQADLAEAQRNSGDLKAAVGRAFADLETFLELLGIQLPPPATAIPNPPVPPTDEEAPAPSPASTDATGTESSPATAAPAEEPGNPIVVDTITGVHVPVDDTTGAPLPVPPIPDVTPTTGTDTSSSTSDASSSGSDASSTTGTDTTSSGTVTTGADPNAGSGAGTAASNIVDPTTGTV